MRFEILDIMAATIFMVCETFLLIFQLLGKFRNPSRRLDRLSSLAGVLAVLSLLYLVGLRFLPYAWICIREAI